VVAGFDLPPFSCTRGKIRPQDPRGSPLTCGHPKTPLVRNGASPSWRSEDVEAGDHRQPLNQNRVGGRSCGVELGVETENSDHAKLATHHSQLPLFTRLALLISFPLRLNRAVTNSEIVPADSPQLIERLSHVCAGNHGNMSC